MEPERRSEQTWGKTEAGEFYNSGVVKARVWQSRLPRGYGKLQPAARKTEGM